MSDGAAESMGGTRLGWWRTALLGLCLLGLMGSVVRGPVGALKAGSSSDFAIFYTATRVWAHGGNPYDTGEVAAEWARVIPKEIWPIAERGPVLLYPPAAFVLISPLAWLPFGAAAAAWAVLNTAMLAGLVWGVVRLAGLRGTAALACVTGCVWLAPLASGVKYGQTGPVIAGCVGLGAWLRARGTSGAGGALEGVGGAVKPQLGLLFVVYELGRGRWRLVGAAVAAGAVLLAIGAGRMWAAGVQWLPVWREQVRQFQLIGDGNPTLSNHVRSQLINLQYPLHSLVDSRTLVNVLVYGILAALCLAYFVVDWRRGRARGEGRGEIVSLAMVAVVTLLVAYHRFYDATVLVFPLAAAARVLSEAGNGARARRAAWGVVVLLGLFVVPITGQLLVLELHGWTVAGRHFELPPGVATSFVWNFVVMPHEVWALLAMAVLLVVMRGGVRQEH